MEKIQTVKYVRLVIAMSGDEPITFDWRNFSTEEEAKKHWKDHYRDRKENDGYDKQWNQVPFITQTIIPTTITKKP